MLVNETARGVAEAARAIARQLPRARILVTAVLPRSANTLPKKPPGEAPTRERAKVRADRAAASSRRQGAARRQCKRLSWAGLGWAGLGWAVLGWESAMRSRSMHLGSN